MRSECERGRGGFPARPEPDLQRVRHEFLRDLDDAAEAPSRFVHEHRALGITLAGHGADLTAGRLTIEPPDRPRDFRIAAGPRVGITRSAELRLRFWIAGNRFVSRPLGSTEPARGRPRARRGVFRDP